MTMEPRSTFDFHGYKGNDCTNVSVGSVSQTQLPTVNI